MRTSKRKSGGLETKSKSTAGLEPQKGIRPDATAKCMQNGPST